MDNFSTFFGKGSQPQDFYGRFRTVMSVPTAVMVNQRKSTCIKSGTGREHSGLTLVLEDGPLICQSDVPAGARFDQAAELPVYTVSTFHTKRSLPAGGKERKYAEAWPRKGLCTKAKPCPLVVNLHGDGAHGDDPNKLQDWGYLNYYNKDPACRGTLRTVMIFPQLMDHTVENFAMHGPSILQDFIVPLTKAFIARNHNVDGARVALAGASEGALGGIMAAILHPDLFSIVVAAAATAPLEHFPVAPQRQSKPSDKLRAIVIAWAGNQRASPDQMGEAMRQLVHAGIPKHAAVRGRFYKGSEHMETAEAVFNHYDMLHQVLWLGQFDLAEKLW